VLLAETLRSSTFKLALLAIGLFGTVMFALIGYLYWSTVSYVQNRSDPAIAAEQTALEETFERAGRDGLVATISQRIADRRLEKGVYLLVDASLVPVSGNLTAWPPGLEGVQGWATVVQKRAPGATDRSVLRAAFATLADGSHLLVGRSIDDLKAFVRAVRAALAGTIGLLIVVAAVAAFSVTRRTVGWIEAINTTSRAIMQIGLGQRIPLRGTRDEWDRLAQNLNLMLERIEELMAEVKQVSDNVAHDLRTPLTRMHARLEKARDQRRERARDQALINDTIADLDTVLAVFSSLLRISQIEGNRSLAFRTVNLAEIADDVVDLFDATAEERGCRIKMSRQERVFVTGDRDLLFDAIANIVDNAIKFGGEAAQVTVEVAERDGIPVVSVADRGPGIPAAERKHVLKRFYRLERSRHTLGNGLGLSLVAAVAKLHDAQIEMLDNAPGLVFQLWFRRSTENLASQQLPGPRLR
jgi:signal transduction histidine kinase